MSKLNVFFSGGGASWRPESVLIKANVMYTYWDIHDKKKTPKHIRRCLSLREIGLEQERENESKDRTSEESTRKRFARPKLKKCD